MEVLTSIINMKKVDIILAGNIAINCGDIKVMNRIQSEAMYWNRHRNDIDVDLVIDLIEAQIDNLEDDFDVDFHVDSCHFLQ
mgnify:CR=1 FL=1